MIRLSSSPDLSHDQKPPTAIPPDIYEILSLEGSEMKKRNVIVCRVKCAVEGVPSGCLLPSLPPGGSRGTEGSRGQAGTLWAGRDTNPRGDAFYGDGRLVEACRRVRRSRPRVGSRDRSPRRTPTKEITGSRNRRGTPLIMDISAMETRMGGLVSDVSTTSLPSKSHHFVLANPRSIRILLLRSTIFLVRFLSRF